jgi:hypothetical protein
MKLQKVVESEDPGCGIGKSWINDAVWMAGQGKLAVITDSRR